MGGGFGQGGCREAGKKSNHLRGAWYGGGQLWGKKKEGQEFRRPPSVDYQKTLCGNEEATIIRGERKERLDEKILVPKGHTERWHNRRRDTRGGRNLQEGTGGRPEEMHVFEKQGGQGNKDPELCVKKTRKQRNV